MTFRVKTPNHNTTVQAHDWNLGSDGWVHFKDETDETVWSVPEANCEGHGPERTVVR